MKNFYASSINDKRLGNDYFLIRSFLHLKFVDMSSMKNRNFSQRSRTHTHDFFIELRNHVLLQMY